MTKKLAIVMAVVLALGCLAVAQNEKPSPTVRQEAQQAQPQPETTQQQTSNSDSWGGLSLPAGTMVRMKLETMISSTASRPGDTFAGRVTQDVSLNGKIVVPVGAAVQGTIEAVNEPRRAKGKPMIMLRPNLITMPNGERYNVSMVVVDTPAETSTKVDNEGRIQGPGRQRRDNIELAAAAGGGTLVGGLTGGTKGALIGATVGGGAAMVHWLTRRYQAVLPAGSEIVLELNRPMALHAEQNGM
jgi:hypothetical protein